MLKISSKILMYSDKITNFRYQKAVILLIICKIQNLFKILNTFIVT